MALAKFWKTALVALLALAGCKGDSKKDQVDPTLKPACRPSDCDGECCGGNHLVCPDRQEICCLQYLPGFSFAWVSETSYSKLDLIAAGQETLFTTTCPSENAMSMGLMQLLRFNPSCTVGEEFGSFFYGYQTYCLDESGEYIGPDPHSLNDLIKSEGSYQAGFDNEEQLVLDGVDFFPPDGSPDRASVMVSECSEAGGSGMQTDRHLQGQPWSVIDWEDDGQVCY